MVPDEPDLQLLVADDAGMPLTAHWGVLALFSSCVKHLPRETSVNQDNEAPIPVTTWDLRGLVLEGEPQPVSRAIVQAWLEMVYSRLGNTTEFSPPATLTAARPLLIFADAVGTNHGVVEEMAARMVAAHGLPLEVPCGPETTVRLQLSNRIYYVDRYSGSLSSRRVPFDCAVTELPADVFRPHAQAFQAAVADALEGWLYLSARLGLLLLVRALLDAFRNTTGVSTPYSICGGRCMAAVFSPRVLAVLPRELLLQGFLSSLLVEPQPSGVPQGTYNISYKFTSAPGAALYATVTGGSATLALGPASHADIVPVRLVTGPMPYDFAQEVDAAVGAATQADAAAAMSRRATRSNSCALPLPV